MIYHPYIHLYCKEISTGSTVGIYNHGHRPNWLPRGFPSASATPSGNSYQSLCGEYPSSLKSLLPTPGRRKRRLKVSRFSPSLGPTANGGRSTPYKHGPSRSSYPDRSPPGMLWLRLKLRTKLLEEVKEELAK